MLQRMQITIDTERENIDAVLRVLSAAYGVEVTLAGADRAGAGSTAPVATAGQGEQAPARGRRGRRATTAAEDGGRARRGRGRPTSASTAQIRAWAREQGHDVPARGRLSAEVISAYEDAHR